MQHKKQAIICDLDGTLCDLTHRLHLIEGLHKDYDSFYSLVSEDSVIPATREMIRYFDPNNTLERYGEYGDKKPRILFVSGRPEKTRKDTILWLNKHCYDMVVVGYNDIRLGLSKEMESSEDAYNHPKLYMRPDNDFRPDYKIKEEILDQILAEGYEVLFAVDDRPQVLEMWQRRGIFTYQVKSHWTSEYKAKNLGHLTLLIGPPGAGKSTFVHKVCIFKNMEGGFISNRDLNIHPSNTISSDQVRQELFGDFRDMSDNQRVFKTVHALVRARIQSGLDCTLDATNLHRRDRLAAVDASGAQWVRYIVLDRPLEDKLKDAGWRSERPGLIETKHEKFQACLKDIFNGDGRRYEVLDLRNQKIHISS